MDATTTCSITVDKAGDTGQYAWVYQKYYASTEGYVIQYGGEDNYSAWLSQLSEKISYVGNIDLGITKTAITALETNMSLLSTALVIISGNFSVISSQFGNAQTIQNVTITKIDHCNDNFIELSSAFNSNTTKVSDYMNAAGIGKYNCKPSVAFDSTKTTSSFMDASAVPITSWIAGSERIYFNGLRTTAYTANSSGGKIVWDLAPTSQDSCIADFQIVSTALPISITTTQLWSVAMSSSDYTEFTSTGILTITTTGWSTWSDTGWIATT